MRWHKKGTGGFFDTPVANPVCAVGVRGMWPILVNTGPRNVELSSGAKKEL